MESGRRTLVKALTWQVLGLAVMTAIGYAYTGSVGAGGRIAASGAVAGLLTYVAHERVWARIAWGRRSSGDLRG